MIYYSLGNAELETVHLVGGARVAAELNAPGAVAAGTDVGSLL